MIPISSFLLDQVVALELTTWGTDADGGRIPAGTVARSDVPAAVLPGRPVRMASDDESSGLRRIAVIWPATVTFACDVGLHVEDLITWVDEADRTHVYQVRGYGPVAGVPGSWVATCEERQ